MIRIEVQEYCQECLNFEPDVEPAQKVYLGSDEETLVVTDTVVRCKYRKRCENIKRYLERKEHRDGVRV